MFSYTFFIADSKETLEYAKSIGVTPDSFIDIGCYMIISFQAESMYDVFTTPPVIKGDSFYLRILEDEIAKPVVIPCDTMNLSHFTAWHLYHTLRRCSDKYCFELQTDDPGDFDKAREWDIPDGLSEDDIVF